MSAAGPAQGAQWIRSAPRVCLFAHFDRQGIARESTLHYLREIRASGFAIVVVSTCQDMAEAEREKLAALCDDLVFRENAQLDWGSWAFALKRYPDLRPSEFMLFCNDSVFGPLWPLRDFIDELTREPADIYGAVGSLEIRLHIQSWFMLVRPSLYDDPVFRKGFLDINPAYDKQQIIVEHEVGVSNRFLSDPRYRVGLAYDPREYPIQRSTPFNASQLLWRELVEDRRIPFVKKEVLRDNPQKVASVNDWRTPIARISPQVASHVAAEFAPRRTGWLERAMRSVIARNAPNRPLNAFFLRNDFRLEKGGWMRRANHLIYSALNSGLRTGRRDG